MYLREEPSSAKPFLKFRTAEKGFAGEGFVDFLRLWTHLDPFRKLQNLFLGFSKIPYLFRVWYIRDEFGKAVEHSDQANVRVTYFLSLINGEMYTLLCMELPYRP